MEPTQEDTTRETPIPAGDGMEPDAMSTGIFSGASLDWENYLRCLFLVIILFALGVMTWRPGLIRLSLLRSLVNPTRGDSLAWAPEADPPSPIPEVKRLRPPAEWRLTAALSGVANLPKPAIMTNKNEGGDLTHAVWRRNSENPWRWQDDADGKNRRNQEQLAATPPQKPESAFRTGDLLSWPEPTPLTTPNANTAGQPGLSSIPALPPPRPVPNREASHRPFPPRLRPTFRTRRVPLSPIR